MKQTLLISALILSLLPLGAVFHKIGEFGTSNTVNSIAVVNNIAYVAEGESGLQIFDVSDPLNHLLLSTYTMPLPWYFNRIAVVDSIAYMGGWGPLAILNVSNPQNPTLLGTCDIGYQEIQSIVVQDSIVYVGDGYYFEFTGLYSGGLQIINVSNPQNPTLLGSYAAPGQVNSVAIVDSIAYIGVMQTYHAYPARLGGLWILNVSNPQNPALIGSYDVGIFDYIYDLTVMGNLAYMAVNEGLQIIDVSNPQSPFLVGSYDAPNWVHSVTVDGGFAYIGYGFDSYEAQNWDGGFQIIDISNPLNPILHSEYDVPGAARFVGVFDGVAYVGSGSVSYFYSGWEGVQMFDVSNPQNSSLLWSCDIPDNSNDVAVEGGIAYVACGDQTDLSDGCLCTIDATDPLNPTLLDSLGTPGCAYSVEVHGNIAYVADGELRFIDVSNPQNLTLLGSYNTWGWAYDCFVIGDIAYVAAGNAGLQIIDVSNPQNPSLLSFYTATWSINSITVQGSIAYVVDGDILKIIDILNLQNLTLLGSLVCNGYVNYSLAAAGNSAYLACGSSGVQVVDASNPALPVVIGNIPTHHATSSINKCYIHENHLNISDVNWYEISIYNIENPQIPVLNNRYAWNLSTNDMCVVDDRLYTVNGDYGLNIHNLTTIDNDDEVQYPATAFQIQNYPNPFNPETTISYTLPAKGQVCLAIYNSKGQLVRRLLDEQQPKGEHTLTWNGKDDDGHSVASGLYFCRITSAGKQESRNLGNCC